MTAGRPRNNEPATAYDYRRYITLVQCLTSPVPHISVAALCKAWGIPRSGDPFTDACALSQHVVEYHREDDDDQDG